MSQYFDALERQLVALSSQAPRMTPQARAKRRLAIGTVTALSLLALVVGSSMLPHLISKPGGGNDALLANLPSKHGSHPRHQMQMGPLGAGHALGASHTLGAGHALDAVYEAHGCGPSVAVSHPGRPARRLSILAGGGHIVELVCAMELGAKDEGRLEVSWQPSPAGR
jgi:hypothetical protein